MLNIAENLEFYTSTCSDRVIERDWKYECSIRHVGSDH